MNVMRHSLLLDAVKTRLSVPSIAVHLHIENTTHPRYRGTPPKILDDGFCSGKTICYDTLDLFLRGACVPPWLLGERMEIDAQRLTDDTYRYEVLTVLLREHQVGIMRYCVTRLGEDMGE